MGQNLAARIKVMFLGASLKQEIAWHDEPENATGKLMTRLSSDTMSIRGKTKIGSLYRYIDEKV